MQIYGFIWIISQPAEICKPSSSWTGENMFLLNGSWWMFYHLFNSFLNTELSSVFGNLTHGITTGTSFFSGGKKRDAAAITGVTRENRKGLHHLLHIGHSCSTTSQQHCACHRFLVPAGFCYLGAVCTALCPKNSQRQPRIYSPAGWSLWRLLKRDTLRRCWTWSPPGQMKLKHYWYSLEGKCKLFLLKSLVKEIKDSKQTLYPWLEKIIILEVVREKSEQLKVLTQEQKTFPIRKSPNRALKIRKIKFKYRVKMIICSSALFYWKFILCDTVVY